jgi:hypothetical protein
MDGLLPPKAKVGCSKHLGRATSELLSSQVIFALRRCGSTTEASDGPDIPTEGNATGEFRLEDESEHEARRVKAAACALVEPDVIRLCRDKQDIRTREALSRLIAAALLARPVPSRCASPHG